MSVVRRFVVASSLVRLIRKERGGSRITEGYFTPQGGRTSLVRIDGKQCHLVLVSAGSSEERTEVPQAHGEALLDVCAGRAAYDRTAVSLAGRDVLIDRYVTPNGLHLASVTFDDEESSRAFALPSWFGTEVSTDVAYDRQNVALQGVPKGGDVVLSNAALDAVLDLLEPRFGANRVGAAPTLPTQAPKPTPTEAKPAPAEAKTVPAEPKAAAAAPEVKAPAQIAPAPPAKPEVPQADPSQPTPSAKVGSAARPMLGGTAEQSPSELAAGPGATPAATAVPAAAGSTEAGSTSLGKPVETGKLDAGTDNAQPPPPPADLAASEAAASGGDSRIDDVIESLSQALGAAIQQPREPAKEDELASSFERWTVRPRRTQQ